MLPIQCKMARVALTIGVRDLARVARVSTNTISRFERGEILRPRTVATIRTALENSGVLFINDNEYGPGVRLKRKLK